MKILWLGPLRQALIDWLIAQGDTVLRWEDKLESESPLLTDVDWIISYGYRYLLKADLLERFERRAINLHISLLPWNRGADPNLWSFLENTPKGVTIHRIDPGIDSGEIFAQKELFFVEQEETLASSYKKLAETIEELFRQSWPKIAAGIMQSYPQEKGGSLHRLKDKAQFDVLLSQGWETPVENLVGKALQSSVSKEAAE